MTSFPLHLDTSCVIRNFNLVNGSLNSVVIILINFDSRCYGNLPSCYWDILPWWCQLGQRRTLVLPWTNKADIDVNIQEGTSAPHRAHSGPGSCNLAAKLLQLAPGWSACMGHLSSATYPECFNVPNIPIPLIHTLHWCLLQSLSRHWYLPTVLQFFFSLCSVIQWYVWSSYKTADNILLFQLNS